MKKAVVLFAFSAALFVSCKNSSEKTQNKDLLSTELVKNPHSAAGTDTAVMNSLSNMSFRDTVYDFGTIREGEIVTHDFEFTNTGKDPLIISGARGSCGCTAPTYPQEPVAPGKTEKIKVEFRSQGKSGHQEKSVVLTTNSVRGTHMLFIKGEVTPTDEK